MRWDIVTGEYPPQIGGVGDHTYQLAEALAAAGDEVHVWTAARVEPPRATVGVEVHALPGMFGMRAVRELSRQLGRCKNGIVFVQYVPQAFGYRGANLLFCLWLWRRRARQTTWTLFHEVEVPFDRKRGLKWNLLAVVTRVMARLVASGSKRIYVSIPAWKHLLPRLSGTPAWLPVPSNLPVSVNGERVRQLREKLAGGSALIGHFSTYTRLIAPLIVPLAAALVKDRSDRRMLFLGNHAGQYADDLRRRFPALASQVCVAEGLSNNEEVAHHLAACDVLIQPYPDGITTRRSTTMASLALAKPVVTNLGHLSEDFWAASGAVVAVDSANLTSACEAIESLLENASAREQLSVRARELYTERFALERAVAKLRLDAGTLLSRAEA